MNPEDKETDVGKLRNMVNNWRNDCMRLHGDIAYYRNLIDVSIKDDPDAYICDDGSKSEDVLRAKLPDIVKKYKRSYKINQL